MIKKQTYLDDCRKQGKHYFESECPSCGWDSISEGGIEEGCCEIIAGRDTQTDFGPGVDIHVKCVCPVCNEEFEYFDGSP